MRLQTLENYPNLAERITLKREMIEVLESAREATTTIISGMPKGSRKAKSRIEEYTAKLEWWVASLNDDILEHTATRAEVDDWLTTLSPDERKIIKARYIDCRDGKQPTWAQVSQKAYCGESQPYRVIERLKKQGILTD